MHAVIITTLILVDLLLVLIIVAGIHDVVGKQRRINADVARKNALVDGITQAFSKAGPNPFADPADKTGGKVS